MSMWQLGRVATLSSSKPVTHRLLRIYRCSRCSVCKSTVYRILRTALLECDDEREISTVKQVTLVCTGVYFVCANVHLLFVDAVCRCCL